MQKLVFFCLIASAFARRGIPDTLPPRAYLPKGYPYGWGMPIPEPEVKPEVEKEKKVKLVKRVVKKPKVDPGKEALRALRWAAVEDMIDGLE